MATNAEILENLNAEVRPWFNRQVAEGLPLARFVDDFTAQKYELQASGIMCKGVTEQFPEELEQLVSNAETFDIVFLRPSTYHNYANTAEVVQVLGGAGKFNSQANFRILQKPFGKLLAPNPNTRFYLRHITVVGLERGMFACIPPGITFGWKPNPKSYLELRVRIAKSASEVTEKDFDKW